MFPNFSINNQLDKMVRYIKLAGENSLSFIFFPIKSSYFYHLRLNKFGSWEITSFRSIFTKVSISTSLESMLFVFFRRNPFKITDSVIQFFLIKMVNFSQILRIRNISRSYQSMYENFFSYFVVIQRNHLVPVTNQPRFQKSSFFPSTRRLIANFRVSPHLSVFCNRIQSFISFNIFHGIYVNSNSVILP